MSKSALGLIAGLLLGVAAAVGGFWAFLLTLVLGLVGLALGAQLEGEVDLPELLRGRRG